MSISIVTRNHASADDGVPAKRQACAYHCREPLVVDGRRRQGAEAEVLASPALSRTERGSAAASPRRGPTGSRAPTSAVAYEATRTSADVRSGNVAANSAQIGPPSAPPSSAARSEPAASITARMSSIISSNEPSARIRSESPVPRRSNMIRRENDAIRSRKRLVRRPPLVLLEVRHVAGREDEVDRPVAEHLVGDVEVAALRVSRLALHGRAVSQL